MYKFITPALLRCGWDIQLQVLEEFSFTDGRIYVKGKLTARVERKRADYIVLYKPGILIANQEKAVKTIIDGQMACWKKTIHLTIHR